MRQEIEQAIAAICNDLFGVELKVELTRPDEQFGDYACNVALQLAKQLSLNPREIAEQIADNLEDHKHLAGKPEVAGPGFLNLRLSDQVLWNLADQKVGQTLAGKVVVAEYSDPNPFKVLHAGHLYTSVVGEGVANLLEAAGAKVYRVNFGGDVGRHVAQTMWAILKELGGEELKKLNEIDEDSRSEWLTSCYIKGTSAYEDDESAKPEITALNKRIYQIHADNDHDSTFAQIYWTCRQWSYDYFDQFYAQIGTKFDKYYPESETAPLGLKTVYEQLEKGIFEKSNGAVIFDGEKYGLHTRVFINSEGLPTYEAKDVGLILKKYQDYHFNKSVVITGNDITEYMKVVLKSIEQFEPDLVKGTAHLTHGMVKLQGGVKMSSRKGNILRAVDVLEAAADANQKALGKHDNQVVLGAVKYAFLKQRTGGDIIYDPIESISLEGNSGPYLQYAHARACSILAKSQDEQTGSALSPQPSALQDAERSLLRKIGEYAEVVDKAVNELMPHHVCTYLYELAQEFNRFYEKNRVIDDPRESLRIKLVQAYTDTLENGLSLLNIHAPEKM